MININLKDLQELNSIVSNNYNLKDAFYKELEGIMLYTLDQLSTNFTYAPWLDDIEHIYNDIELDGLNEHNTDDFFTLLQEVTK